MVPGCLIPKDSATGHIAARQTCYFTSSIFPVNVSSSVTNR